MQKVFFMFKLKQGKREDYKRWTVARDQMIVPYQPGILRYHVWEIEGWIKEGEPPYSIIEELEVDSWEKFLAAFNGEAIAGLRSEFAEFFDDSVPPVFIYGDKLPQSTA